MTQRYEIPGGKRHKRVSPSQKDLEKICGQLEDEEAELAARLTAETAIRPRELKNLNWDDICLQEGFIQIDVRSNARRRTLPIKREEWTERLLNQGKEEEKLISSDENIQYRLRRAKKELEVPQDVEINLQGFRWTAISKFFERDWHFHQVLTLLGRRSYGGRLLQFQNEVLKQKPGMLKQLEGRGD